METKQVIKARYSCRNYTDKPIDQEVLVELLTLANTAPSAGNQQNRSFVIITDKDARTYLANMNNQTHLADAPVVILATTKIKVESEQEYLNSLKEWEMTVNGLSPEDVKIDEKFSREYYDMKTKWMISDVAAAVQTLLLAATDKGLGSCWLGIMDFEGVKKRFKLPTDQMPVCLITLGYSKEPPKYKTSRKDINELLHWGKW